MPVLVITGTGTEVGKTVTTAAVAAVAVAAGRSVAVLKPAQTGVPRFSPARARRTPAVALALARPVAQPMRSRTCSYTP